MEHHLRHLINEAADEEDMCQKLDLLRRCLHPFKRSDEGLTDNWIYWAAWIFPLLVIIGAAVWRRSRDAREAALAGARRRNALPNARASLRRAVADGEDRAVASADAVTSYLNDRLGDPMSGRTRDALGERLMSIGVTDELVERVKETLALGETARYTPDLSYAGAPNDVAERTVQILIDLDGALESMTSFLRY